MKLVVMYDNSIKSMLNTNEPESLLQQNKNIQMTQWKHGVCPVYVVLAESQMDSKPLPMAVSIV